MKKPTRHVGRWLAIWILNGAWNLFCALALGGAWYSWVAVGISIGMLVGTWTTEIAWRLSDEAWDAAERSLSVNRDAVEVLAKLKAAGITPAEVYDRVSRRN